MNFAQAFAASAPTVGGLPLATFLDLQQMVVDGCLSALIAAELDLQVLKDHAEDVVDLALRKARQSK